MDLLTDAERAEIRGAIHDVTDTFCKTPIVVRVKIDNADRMGGQAGISFTDYDLLAFVEYGHIQHDEVFVNEDGTTIRAEIKCLLNLDDMGEAGLIDSNEQPIINMATDKVVLNGITYGMLLCAVDGGIENRNLICNIFGNREPTET